MVMTSTTLSRKRLRNCFDYCHFDEISDRFGTFDTVAVGSVHLSLVKIDGVQVHVAFRTRVALDVCLYTQRIPSISGCIQMYPL